MAQRSPTKQFRFFSCFYPMGECNPFSRPTHAAPAVASFSTLKRMTSTDPTRGQLERSLTQGIQSFFRDHIGQRPSKAVCQFFDSGVSLILENTLSPAEQTLIRAGQMEAASELRSRLQTLVKPQLREWIQSIVRVPVLSVMMDTDLETGWTGLNAVLKETPPVRDPETIPKGKREREEE